jgi:hypothetical protein
LSGVVLSTCFYQSPHAKEVITRVGALTWIPVCAGKLYTLVTGANERRWDKVKDKLETVARSFVVSTKYEG